jgi:hypothetical protein
MYVTIKKLHVNIHYDPLQQPCRRFHIILVPVYIKYIMYEYLRILYANHNNNNINESRVTLFVFLVRIMNYYLHN